jgi:predicted small integral membrane protein
LPKYTHPLLLRLFKATPYTAFINAYPHNTALMREIYEKERQTFQADKNVGLLQQAAIRAPRWVLKKLTATYVTLHLSDIGRVVKIDSEDGVRALLLSMVCYSPMLVQDFHFLISRWTDRIERHYSTNFCRWNGHVLRPARAVHQGASRQRA